jgi:hypothetical protein
MVVQKVLPALLLALAAAHAGAACAPVRVGYIDKDRPPYWLGTGDKVADPPGASVELLKEFGASAGCPVTPVRLPVLRLRSALESGAIDFAPLEMRADNPAGVVFPMDKNNRIDQDRSFRNLIAVFVNARDKGGPAADIDPSHHFQGRLIGTTHGAAYADQLRQAGIKVDDGAADIAANVEKLKLHRIDGFAVTLIEPNDMDAIIAARYGGEIVRLEKPLSTTRIWLASNRAYYEGHRDQVEAMWTWLGTNGRTRFNELVKKYTRTP